MKKRNTRSVLSRCCQSAISSWRKYYLTPQTVTLKQILSPVGSDNCDVTVAPDKKVKNYISN